MKTIEDIVLEAYEAKSSDILLSQNTQLYFRVDGEEQGTLFRGLRREKGALSGQ